MSFESITFHEKSLLKSLKRGDEMAFRRIYDHYFPSIFRYAQRFLKCRELAEEAVHDVFLKLWEYSANIDEGKPLSPLLYRICKNHVLNVLDKAAKDPVLLKEITAAQLTANENGPEEVLIQREFESKVNRAIDLLPPVRQQVFRLCRLEGKSYEEVADMLGISKGTVNSHIIKANRSLEKVINLGAVVFLLGMVSSVAQKILLLVGL